MIPGSPPDLGTFFKKQVAVSCDVGEKCSKWRTTIRQEWSENVESKPQPTQTRSSYFTECKLLKYFTLHPVHSCRASTKSSKYSLFGNGWRALNSDPGLKLEESRSNQKKPLSRQSFEWNWPKFLLSFRASEAISGDIFIINLKCGLFKIGRLGQNESKQFEP